MLALDHLLPWQPTPQQLRKTLAAFFSSSLAKSVKQHEAWARLPAMLAVIAVANLLSDVR